MPHTPGPWAAGASLISNWSEGRQAKRNTQDRERIVEIALVREPLRIARGGPDTMDEYEANVRLITAAPDLLEALRAIVHQALQGSVLERDACLRQAQEAIAKATMKPG